MCAFDSGGTLVMSPAKKSQKKPQPIPKPVIFQFNFLNPPPPPLPQSADSFDHQFEPYHLECWINKYIDKPYPRQHITGNQIEIGAGEVLMLLERVYQCIRVFPHLDKFLGLHLNFLLFGPCLIWIKVLQSLLQETSPVICMWLQSLQITAMWIVWLTPSHCCGCFEST